MSTIVGDIGGTQARLELRVQNTTLYRKVYKSANYPDLIAIICRFIEDIKNTGISIQVGCLCVAIAGPIVEEGGDQRIKPTHLSWSCSAKELRDRFSVDSVFLLNDLQAAAYGISQLCPEDLLVIHEGKKNRVSPRLLLGLGTGFGQSLSIDQKGRSIVLSTEAGHMNFAPFNAFSHFFYEAQCLVGRNDYSAVTVETMLSSQGLLNICHYLLRHSSIIVSDRFRHAIENSNQSEMITEYANCNELLAEKTIEHYLELLAGYIGNVALSCLPAGGIYMMGGVAQHIIPWLQPERFMRLLMDKGSMSSLLEQLPVYIVKNDYLGLEGAYYIAQQRCGMHREAR
ncbi:hypothetical protein AB835_03335 [Candidatus Endobugula sertula]|uniref:Glucokinase n=1 Tax=Candidatus Endobugula sertula TaxID=62101 RepID=A0A1D2QSD2_9GAMM|nr:hypothetical protein AB835_03335 [Candidatus Endobugula sertula]